MNKEFCIIIPCYNEEKRLDVHSFELFLNNTVSISICFVNDGSKDDTIGLLHYLDNKFPSRIYIISYSVNMGKAEAVRKGMLFCLKELDFKYIGYSDADLSVPLNESFRLISCLKNEVEFCFGSRIAIIGSNIERSIFRHIFSRIIATIIANILIIKVYDTQCGFKFFTCQVAKIIFQEPFISRWLFDVELFARMIAKYGRQVALNKMLEVPLKESIDKPGSKVKITYFFKFWSDLFSIKKKYGLKMTFAK